MEANLPGWSKAAVGREVSADEFLNDPELQRKIVRHRLGGYYNQYGPEGAASMWFNGTPSPKGRKDSLGTSDWNYVRRATRVSALDPEDQPVVHAASGGLIEDTYSGDDESGGSNPAVRDAVENPDDGDDFDTISEMADRGIMGVQRLFGMDRQVGVGAADPRMQQGREAFARNIGAPSPADINRMRDTVDPERKLSPEQRAIKAWKAVYDFHTQKGNAPAAQRAAQAMVMYTKAAAQQGGAVMDAALEKGDIVGAAKAAANVYSEIPDGKRLEVGEKTKNGVKFKLYDDATGEITEQGEATMDQMVQLSTGLRNGTEWFRAVGALAQKKTDKVGARQEKERQAINAFEEGSDDEFLDTLSEKERTAWPDLPANYREKRRSEWMRDKSETYKENRFERRQLAAAEKEDFNRKFKMFNAARQQGNWEKTREQVMDAQDRRLALIERDLSDRNVRHQESQEARQKRYEEIDRRILERGAKQGIRLTAGERADQAIDTAAGTQRSAIDLDADRQLKAQMGSKADTELGDEDVAAAEAIRAKRDLSKEAVSGETAYGKRTNDPSRKFNEETSNRAMGSVQEIIAKEANVPADRLQGVQSGLGYVASDIARSSDVPPEIAGRIAVDAFTKGVKANPDGSFSIANHPPVFLSAHSRLELARLQGSRTKPPPTAGTAPPANAKGAAPTGNVSGVPVPASGRKGVVDMASDAFYGVRDAARRGLDKVAPAPVPERREWVSPPKTGIDTSKYDTNPARRRKELREARRRGIPV
jgi:hypothetical protein